MGAEHLSPEQEQRVRDIVREELVRRSVFDPAAATRSALSHRRLMEQLEGEGMTIV